MMKTRYAVMLAALLIAGCGKDKDDEEKAAAPVVSVAVVRSAAPWKWSDARATGVPLPEVTVPCRVPDGPMGAWFIVFRMLRRPWP